MSAASSNDASSPSPYRVLARKYRPNSFDELIGQGPLVRTLTNAINTGRIAQAFMLTGVRGVGKTTVARLIAKCLNASDGPTIDPDPDCEHGVAIGEDRHPDVIEMDAASRTGVGDIRELIDGVRYKPTWARYKVYILDEVHMLSAPAFNALLKTLEEPPEHVKFVFATTEIRKVPVTVLSRCQRFDLRRIPMDQLAAHFRSVAAKEGVTIEDDAVSMVARAADGSARDGLSILDQAIALSGETVTSAAVQDMLGLADRAAVYDLYDAVMRGDTVAALDGLRAQYDAGIDPVVILQDLLGITHWLTRIKLDAGVAERPGTAEIDRVRGTEMAGDLRLPVLTRAWQMLLKGIGEVQAAPHPVQAAEMVLIRLMHASGLKTPADLMKEVAASNSAPAGPPGPEPPPAGSNGGPTAAVVGGDRVAMPEPSPSPAQVPQTEPTASAPRLDSFEDVVALLKHRREGLLHANLYRNAHLVRFERGRIELHKTDRFPSELLGQLGQLLTQWTGERWVVLHSEESGAETLYERDQAVEQARRVEAARDPVVKAVLEAFPDATVAKVIDHDAGFTETVGDEDNESDEDEGDDRV